MSETEVYLKRQIDELKRELDRLKTNVPEVGGVWQDWTPTFAGFSTDPYLSCRYCVVGKLSFLNVTNNTVGVSNATNFTISLPIQAGATHSKYFPIRYHDNSVTASIWGMGVITSGSTVIQLYINPAGHLWTASGNKTAWFECFYEIA